MQHKLSRHSLSFGLRIPTQLNALILLFLFILSPSIALAKDPVRQFVPQAEKVGQGILTFAFWDVYEATLYAPRGEFNAKRPFALSIRYFRDLAGQAIADTSASEIRRQGFTDTARLQNWQQQMTTIFPDVTAGTVLTAIYLPGNKTVFYNDDRQIGTVKDPAFGPAFFGIWLENTTAKPALRKALLGL